MGILAQRRWGCEILSAAVSSSLNDNPARVKEEVITRACLENIPLDDKQFDISWEAQASDNSSTLIFMALAPAHHPADVEHALPVISQPSNNSIQFPATHNYQLISQTCFDPCGQLQKTIQSQRAHLNNQRFLVIDGLYRVDFDTEIPNTPST